MVYLFFISYSLHVFSFHFTSSYLIGNSLSWQATSFISCNSPSFLLSTTSSTTCSPRVQFLLLVYLSLIVLTRTATSALPRVVRATAAGSFSTRLTIYEEDRIFAEPRTSVRYGGHLDLCGLKKISCDWYDAFRPAGTSTLSATGLQDAQNRYEGCLPTIEQADIPRSKDWASTFKNHYERLGQL